MSEERPPELPRPKTRLPFETRAPSSGVHGGAAFAYGIVAAGLALLALYMGFIEQRPLTSPYVVAPAIGAAWFALRLFMTMRPRE